ncbi:hypothetical protein JCM10213v2_007389 [Rhodosporidiobolus nylandii]
MPRLRVAPAQPVDFPSLVRIQRAALAPVPFERVIFGGVTAEDYAAYHSERFLRAAGDPPKALLKAVLSREGKEDSVLGMALWELPKLEGAPDEPPKPRKWPNGARVELAAALFGRRLRERHYRGMPLYRRYGFENHGEPLVGGENGEIELIPMVRSPTRIVPCSAADVPALPSIYYLAFRASTVNRYCYPDVTAEAYIPWITTRFTAVLEARERGEKTEVIVAKRGEKVLGYASFAYVPEAEKRVKEMTARTFPAGSDLQRASTFMAMFDRHKEQIREAHWSLDNLAILPEAQGQGLGTALSLPVLKRAQADVVCVTLESTEFGVALYEKLGFARMGAPLVAEDLPGVEQLWPMVYGQRKEP